MKRLLIFAAPILGIAALLLYWYIDLHEETPVQQISVLEKTGDDCDSIAEKAAMNLPEVLPFQKLEKAARRAKVLEVCMHDRGFVENPKWQVFAKPIAQKNAQIAQMSFDEAYENLRRASMLKFKPQNNEPSYWMLELPQNSR